MAVKKQTHWVFRTLYTAIMVYGAGIIFGSMLYELYGKPDAAEAAKDPAWCKGQLATLRAELENQAQEEFQAVNPGERRAERWKKWQEEWQTRFQRASMACTHDAILVDAYATLNEISTDYNGVLQELSGTRVRLRNHLEEAVRRLTKK